MTIEELTAACRKGAEPGLVSRMPSGWAVMGRRQVLEGYCLLLPDPPAPHLNALTQAARDQFMIDLGRLGQAVLDACSAVRVNYAIFGNVEPTLHAHVHPRYASEPVALREANPWGYDWSVAPEWSETVHGALRDQIRTALDSLR